MSALQNEIKTAIQETTQPLERRLADMQHLLEKSLKSTQKPFVTVDEAAELTGQSTRTIRRKVHAGMIEAKRMGRKILIDREALLSV